MDSGKNIIEYIFRVLSNPSKSFQSLEEARRAAREVSSMLDNALSESDSLRQENERLANLNATLSQQLQQNMTENDRLKARVEDLQNKLSLHLSMDEKMEAFDKKLSGFEEMKVNYEREIESLRSKLRVARSRLNSFSASRSGTNSDLLDSIDMSESFDNSSDDDLPVEENERPLETIREPRKISPETPHVIPKIKEEKGTSRFSGDFSENLFSMIEREEKEKELKKENYRRSHPPKEKRAPGLPEHFPEPSDSDDWLLTLPDDI